MAVLSINVNKIATLRNSRGGDEPSLLRAVDVCLAAGVRGITVHPRADERHITRRDVFELAERLARSDARDVEYNIEGDPRPEWLDWVHAVKPHQATLVPVRPGEVTSEAGWPADTKRADLAGVVDSLKGRGIRVSVFVDPVEEAVQLAREVGADRIELYTEPYARAFAHGQGQALFQQYVRAAELAHDLGLGINAGHDLDLDNLPLFLTLPHLAEVSIGHALMSRAMFEGLSKTAKEYLALVEGRSA